MSALKNKIDFVAIVAAHKANVNGDPLSGNRPRIDYDGYGEISDVCIKRKIRNRMQDLSHDDQGAPKEGQQVFVQSSDRTDDGYASLSERARKEILSKCRKDEKEIRKQACAKWIDVRAFGQLFAFKATSKEDSNPSESIEGNTDSEAGESSQGKKASAGGVSIGIRGPVTIQHGRSVDPIIIDDYQITKSVSSEPGEKRGPDTMGMKHCVRFGLYVIRGAINTQLAKLTGFSDEDADVLKECLRTLFVNDASAARPEGSMEVVRLYWFKQDNKEKRYSSAKVHRSVVIKKKDGVAIPSSIDDYDISVEPLDGLTPEVIEGE